MRKYLYVHKSIAVGNSDGFGKKGKANEYY